MKVRSVSVLCAVLLACREGAAPPAAGVLEVTVVTAGVDLGNSYQVRIDGGDEQSLSPVGALSVTLAPGSHTVELLGATPNCRSNPLGFIRTVDVSVAGIARAHFAVTCVARVGTVVANIQTTGDGPPADYRLILDDAISFDVQANGPVTLGGLREGSHTLALVVPLDRCAVLGPAARNVDVAFEVVTPVDFRVTCRAEVVILIRTTTTGVDRDPDGYTLRNNSLIPGTPIGVDAELAITLTASRDVVVWLEGVAPNCRVAWDSSWGTARRVSVTLPATVAQFAVTCAAMPVRRLAPTTQLAFVRDGRIHVASADGSGARALTAGPSDGDPAWSPDGERIAYRRLGEGIHVMNADGSRDVRITSGYWDAHPSWSPDGAEIAFESPGGGMNDGRRPPGTDAEVLARRLDGSMDVFVIRADVVGALPRPLVENPGWDAHPAWSPVGQTMAYASDFEAYDFASDIYLRRDDGSSRQLTSLFQDGKQHYQPSWSPDGSRIAIVSCVVSLLVCDASQVELLSIAWDRRVLTPTRGFATPSWSPDGQVIAYGGAGAIFWVRVDGTEHGIITGDGDAPAWRPQRTNSRTP